MHDDYAALRRDPDAKAEQQRQWHRARRRSRHIFVLLVAIGVLGVLLFGAAMFYAAMLLNVAEPVEEAALGLTNFSLAHVSPVM